MKRRLIQAGRSSTKFWEIEPAEGGYAIRYGREGTDGQRKLVACHGRREIERAIAKRVAAKLRGGYTEVETPEAVFARTDHRAAMARAPKLEAAIVEAPKHADADADAWSVYADWLDTQGDPRAEIIHAQLRRASTTSAADKRKLGRFINARRKQQQPQWLGQLAHLDFSKEQLKLRWEHCFILGAVVQPDRWGRSARARDLLHALLRAPGALLLQDLLIAPDDHGKLTELIASFEGISPLDSLRALTLGDPEHYWDISHVEVGPIDPILAAAPKLRRLAVRGNGIQLEQLRHPTLESVAFETSNLEAEVAQRIATAKLPACTALTVYFGDSRERGCTATLADVRPLLRAESAKRLPALTHLGLCNAEFEDELAAAVARSSILPRLSSLSLSQGTLRGPGVDAIVRRADAFRHLRRLDLSENYIDEDDRERLRDALPEVELELSHQRCDEDDDDEDDEDDDYDDEDGGERRYYVSVSE